MYFWFLSLDSTPVGFRKNCHSTPESFSSGPNEFHCGPKLHLTWLSQPKYLQRHLNILNSQHHRNLSGYTTNVLCSIDHSIPTLFLSFPSLFQNLYYYIKAPPHPLLSPPAFSTSPLSYSKSLRVTSFNKNLHKMKSALYYAGCEEKHCQYEPHFLDSCFLCQRPLAQNSDIFMYRGNTPFCSQECRQEQIEIDEAKERRWNRSNRKTTDSRKESASNKTIRNGAVAVA